MEIPTIFTSSSETFWRKLDVPRDFLLKKKQKIRVFMIFFTTRTNDLSSKNAWFFFFIHYTHCSYSSVSSLSAIRNITLR